MSFYQEVISSHLQKEKNELIVKKAFEPISMATLGLAAKAILSSKALNSGSSYLMRSNKFTSPFFKPFYRGMSQLGWNGGLDASKQLMPNWRKVLGMVFPTQSGVMDYEFSKNMAQLAKEHNMEGYPSSLPEAPDQIQSPLLQNFLTRNQSPIPDYLKSLPQGPDISSPSHFAKGMMLNTVLNPHGAAGALIDAAVNPAETGLSPFYSNDKLKTLTNVKAKTMAFGANPSRPILNSIVQPALKLYDPAFAEFHQAGRDIYNVDRSLPNPNFKPNEWDYDPSNAGEDASMANNTMHPALGGIKSYLNEEAAHPIMDSVKQDMGATPPPP